MSLNAVHMDVFLTLIQQLFCHQSLELKKKKKKKRNAVAIPDFRPYAVPLGLPDNDWVKYAVSGAHAYQELVVQGSAAAAAASHSA